ncbi:MAG: zinc ribbon domain-containing protein [Desulfuromonadia bacterium]
MPVYEFYCPDCHTIFNFLSRRVVTDRTPACPRCSRVDLFRKVSPFAVSKNRPEKDGDNGMPDIDESRLEKAMMGLASEMEGIDENDPRQMARFMKKFAEATGMNLDGEMGEAIRRLEEGADPEELDEELGNLFDDDSMASLFVKEGVRGVRKRLAPPEHDDTLYPFDPA